MNAGLTVFLKEVVENLRDRKTVMNALVMGPLLGPVLFAFLMGFMISKQLDNAEKPLQVPVAGAEHAPNLVAWLRRQGVDVQDAPADPEATIRGRQARVVLRIPADYGAYWRQGRTAQVEVLHDSSDQEARAPHSRLVSLLEAYGRQQSALRISARGLHPAILQPLAVASRDLASRQQRAGQLLAFLPYLLVLGSFLGGMYLAIDTTAGERERQSLEPLLANPASRAQIVLGKLGATFAFAMASMMLSLVVFGIAFRYIPLDRLGMKVEFGASLVLSAGLLMVPLVICFAALQTVVAAYARSYREAQTYLSLLMLLPMIPSVVLMVSPMRPEDWNSAVPLLSQNLLVMALARGEEIGLLRYGLSFGATLALATLLVWLAVRIYHREQLAVSA
ncbi:ABC transporter permease [Arenimonas fontis]|uniref:ABC transporter permease n=1 Tax=Arenimonas fontis TaxID=2608255 RepID=A0A5B2Z7T6_9GAMM|nr:ABC transporter permease [Arenimonas fontis]KAA2284029.1 ABC transporter permease [Arenimonas fontis]